MENNKTTSNKSFIAVEGSIGVGKTKLAKKLAHSFQGLLIDEDASKNPFLEKFYRAPTIGALPVQLFFLFQRISLLKDVLQNDMFIQNTVANFLMDKDRLFAQITLDQDELNLYNQVYQNLTIEAPTPDLVIYLQASTDVLLKGIRQRNIAVEHLINQDYLEKLNQAYTDFFHYYDASPLLIVNVSAIDLIDNEQHYQQFLEQIEIASRGRHYFNPTVY